VRWYGSPAGGVIHPVAVERNANLPYGPEGDSTLSPEQYRVTQQRGTEYPGNSQEWSLAHAARAAPHKIILSTVFARSERGREAGRR